MKVRVTLVVEVDPEEWSFAYDTSPEDVRQDVKRYIANGVEGASDAPIKVLEWK
jgi:hypothetical protein